jgi:F0F1-type ATP synthase membrane subunit b/b'
MDESRPPISAAEIAAGQIATIVTAAEQAAADIAANAERDARERLREADRDADNIRNEATKESTRLQEEAQAEAVRVAEIARKEADQRIETAQQAADEVLAQAEALSNGLHQLAASLEGQAGSLLRDVQAGHRRLTGDLRIAGGPPEPTRTEPARSERRDAASALEDLEIPTWAEGPSG